MERKFHYTAPAKPMPVVFEQVFAEKPAGGVIPNPAHDIMPGTALDASGKPIKAYRLTKAVGSSDTTIQIEKRKRYRIWRHHRTWQEGRCFDEGRHQ